MGISSEFRAFLQKYQVLGLAIAFVIGAASTKLISATVNDLIMPVVAVLVPNGDWRAATWNAGPVKFLVGDFLGNVIDFLIVAIVIFLLVKYTMRQDATAKR